MAYLDIYSAATSADSTLFRRACVAMMKAAVDIVNESAGTTNHANRILWAAWTLKAQENPMTMARAWIWKILENATIQANPLTATDSDVQFVVNGIADTMANAFVVANP